eukprot:9603247-Karenia_brevis.AAC.1
MFAINDSERQLFLQNDILNDAVSRSTCHRYFKELYWYRCTKRKLDVCKKCKQWDDQLMPAANASMRSWKAELETIHAASWKRWHAEVLPTMSKNDSNHVSDRLITSFAEYVTQQRDARSDDLPASVVARLMDAEDAILHELHKAWSKLKDDEVGLLT